jgi:catechol 2,3-dioxygenase-like lactoylglutathione lyase family enzyme
LFLVTPIPGGRKTSKTATLVRQISLVCVPTLDQDRAITFYESIGFEKRTDTPFGGRYRWVEVYLPEGTTGIALAPPPPGQEFEPAQTGITLTTDDIDATHAAFRSLGIDIDAEVSRMGDPVPPMFWFSRSERSLAAGRGAALSTAPTRVGRDFADLVESHQSRH